MGRKWGEDKNGMKISVLYITCLFLKLKVLFSYSLFFRHPRKSLDKNEDIKAVDKPAHFSQASSAQEQL